MPFLFIIALIFLIIAAIGVLVAVFGSKAAPNSDTIGSRAVGILMVLVFGFGGALSLIFSSFNSVGTYDIGVTTNFGKVVSYVGPGAHFIPPWDNMALMDESVQNVDETLKVRVAGQQTAQATVALRVQLVPSATDALFKVYKGNTQNVITSLVRPALNKAMNGVYDGYDPILPLSTGAKPGTPDNPTTGQLSAQVEAALNKSIGTQVKVDNLTVQPLVYDNAVEQRISSIVSQAAKTDVAKQAEKTAVAQAAANDTIEASLAKNPLVIANNCMSDLADGKIQNEPGFSCYANSGSSVVIPASK